MKKILFTSNVSWAMIKFRYGLIKHLVAEGYELYVVAPHDEFVPQLEALGCHCIDIKLSRKGVNPIEDMKLTYNLFKIYRSIKPDIIFTYSIKPIIYGSIAARLAGINSIAVNIGLGYTFIHNNLVSKISKLLYKFSLIFAKEVWFINEDDRDEFVEKNIVKRVKTAVLPSEGIDVDYFAPSEKSNSGKITFLLIARMLYDKGVSEFVEAARILHQKYSNIECQLLGPIDMENPKGISKETIDSWVNNKDIVYLGYDKDVRKYIANADCVVLPSYREGKGMTLIEAASMAKPLIATNVEGCKDIVDEGINGFLCEVRNSLDLAGALERMYLLSPEERIEMGVRGRGKVSREFDENIVIGIYQKTINHYTQ